MFSSKDKEQIAEHGLSVESVNSQIDHFKTGFPFVNIDRPARLGDGIRPMDGDEAERWAEHYRRVKAGKHIGKFVPASGAATRMFKDLYEYLETGDMNATVQEVLDRLYEFAFAEKVTDIVGSKASDREIIDAIVNVPGLGYGTLPKALIFFHRYMTGNRTAACEHLVEMAMYGVVEDKNLACIHFTVSPEHIEPFEDLFQKVIPIFDKIYDLDFKISISMQKKSTDTIAVNMDNTPFREPDGSLLFRPAGHGALIENLNDLEADLCFIKTVDNVVPDCHKPTTVLYKEALAGLMFSLQEKVFDYMHRVETEEVTDALIDEITDFFRDELSYRPSENFLNLDYDQKLPLLKAALDRPIRVCGMVRNEGEPGGGPFWVKDKFEGGSQLQILESSQISPAQKHLMQEATHFNPVDIVCGMRNHKGVSYDLKKFVDPETGFISIKSRNGKELKAQELPGLWNGAMNYWNTIFVEVPIETFAPVKMVTDLLRPEHKHNLSNYKPFKRGSSSQN